MTSGFVCLEADLSQVPEPPDAPGADVIEMDPQDPRQVDEYLGVHNSAFVEPWGPEEYVSRILEHPSKHVTSTFLLVSQGRAVGAASIGVFRRNPGLGLGHYLGIRSEHQRRGLGRWLALYRFHRLRLAGIARAEVETRVRYAESILLHFECGFRPKLEPSEWNTPQSEPDELRRATRRWLEELYSGWRASRRGAP